MIRQSLFAAGAALLILTATACGTTATAGSSYMPKTRSIDMVTTQALIAEYGNIQGLQDEEANALKDGGPLNGHEAYAWNPSNITAYVGDTVKITIHNAQKDQHIFALPDYNVSTVIPPDGVATVSFKVTRADTFHFICAVPDHMPWMQGFLTVLPDSDAGS